MWWFKNKEEINAEKINDIEVRLNKLECEHKCDRVFSCHSNWGLYEPQYKQECWICKKVLFRYDNNKDYLTAKNKYMAELIAKNEKIILEVEE